MGRNKLLSGLAGILLSAGCMNSPIYDCSSPADDAWTRTEKSLPTYEINLKYDKGDVSIEYTNLLEGNFKPSVIQGNNFLYAVYNFAGEKIYQEGFDFPLTVVIEGEGMFHLDEGERSVFIPVREDMWRFEVYDNDCNYLTGINLTAP